MSSSAIRHVAIIMDGNGRWAEARGMSRVEGHRVGAESVRDITRAAREHGLAALTLYAFSSQNWGRPPAEIAALMELLANYLRSERQEILDNQIRLHAIGDVELLPSAVREPLLALCAESAANTGMVLTLALSYGGRESIARAVAALATDVAAGTLAARDVTVDALSRYLPTSILPPVDLMIRTSGEVRISNFLLWELAYAELLFVDTPWPDFRKPAFLAALHEAAGRDRRFGLVT
ncbi:MAG: di-trans,poly-cis-decaprenylcistransferase [Myxococcales bacterium]|nr:di-trans,poly-cis-decaprenylcistransferase [Myxococcales bacterium]